MKKNKLKAFLLAICIALPTMFALTACGHKHKYSEDWSTDATSHWHACTSKDCKETKDSAEHTFEATNTTETTHKLKCSVCGYEQAETAHTFAQNHNDTKHWQECSCGYKKDEIIHTLTNTADGTYTHKMGCVDCGYIAEEEAHSYESDSETNCDVCLHERNEATLAFKTGTYTFTYDGSAHAFDKSSLVQTNVSLDEVVVEYSATHDNPVWTTDIPVNAGTYYIRLTVEANGDHTGLTINSLEDQSKAININKKVISLTNVVMVYNASELNTNTSQKSLTLTSADVEGLCGSDTLQAKLYKQSGTNTFSEGEEWVVEELQKQDHASKYVGIQASGNYKFDTTTTGKLYVAKDTTLSGEGTSTSPYIYTAEATIAQHGIVYYSASRQRTNGIRHAINFDVELSDSNAEIVDVFTKSNGFSATLVADGTLVVYGGAGNPTVYIGVKYSGSDANKAVSLTLTQNSSTTTISSTDYWSNALNFAGSSRVHISLKKDGSVLEECKYDRDNRKYYKNNQGTEVYYDMGAIAGCYTYTKTDGGNWTRTTTSYDSINEADLAGYDGTKFSSAWLGSFVSIFDLFTFSNEDQMYHLESYTVGEDDVTYTDIALKFENNKLVYAEYKTVDDASVEKHTIEVEYPEIVNISFPTNYTTA